MGLISPGRLAWPPRQEKDGADLTRALGLASTCLRAQAGPPPARLRAGPAPCGLCAAAVPALFIYMLYIFIYYGRRAWDQRPSSTCAHMPALAPPSCRGRAALALDLLPPFSFAQFAAIAPSSSSSRCRARGGFSQVGSRLAALAPILPAGRKPWGARGGQEGSGEPWGPKGPGTGGQPPTPRHRASPLACAGAAGELSSPPQLQYRPHSSPRQREAGGPSPCSPQTLPWQWVGGTSLKQSWGRTLPLPRSSLQ